MKKLIPALCMLLVAAALLGTSTFAWFSMSQEVTAGSMQIKATTDANLFIAKGASVALDGILGASVNDLNVTAASVKPAELTADGGTVTVKNVLTFEDGQAATVSNAGQAKTFTNIGTITHEGTAKTGSEELSAYVAVGYVSIARKQDATGGQYQITPTCTVQTSANSNLNKALRAGIIINGAFYESIDANTADGPITFTFSNAITGLTDNTAYSVALLLWFEGEDSDCTAANASTLANCTATWTFESANWSAQS